MLEIGAMMGQAAFRTNGPIYAVFLLTAVRPHRWCISSQRAFRAFHYHGQPFGTKRPIRGLILILSVPACLNGKEESMPLTDGMHKGKPGSNVLLERQI